MKKLNITKDFLHQEYIINKKSCSKIAKETGCNYNTIWRYLIIHDILIRTQSEAIKGELNPMFGKLGYLAGGYIDGRTLKSYFCVICGDFICIETGLYGSGKCSSCVAKERMKNPRNNPNWQGGISFEPYPIAWTKVLKESIRIRDNHQCQICGKTTKKNARALDVHHIDYDKDNLNPKNLISLCTSCHCKTNYNRDIYIEYFGILKEILK